MSQELDVDVDPFLRLLTDALRAGPGSPEWHQAVARVRASGTSDPSGGPMSAGQADEYRMLIAARENLESGKEYRAVRAGAGFTRKVMEGIEREGRGDERRGLPTATLIAIASALVIVGVVLFVGYLVYPRTPETPKATVEDLLRVRGQLMTETAVARFDAPGPNGSNGPGGSDLPDGWRRIGGLPLETAKGLRPATNAATTEPTTAPSGGGIVAPGAISPDEPFVAEAVLRLGRPTDDTLFEFFVTTDPNFSPGRAKSANDLVWLLQDGRQKVLLSGREQTDKPRPEPAKRTKVATGAGAAGGTNGTNGASGDNATSDAADPTGVPVRILMNRDSAVVECDGQQIWAGPHGLPAAPRYVGVRFLRTGPKPHDPAAVLELRVRKK